MNDHTFVFYKVLLEGTPGEPHPLFQTHSLEKSPLFPELNLENLLYSESLMLTGSACDLVPGTDPPEAS